MMRCVHCDTELVAPVRSEYWSDKHARHIWLCPKCCACFSSSVSFTDDTDTEPRRRDNSILGFAQQLRQLAIFAAIRREVSRQ